MAGDILTHLREQAERSSPEVKAAALLRLARVESVFDQANAGRLLDAGIDAARQAGGLAAECLTGHARLIAAAFAPDRVGEIAEERPPAAVRFAPDMVLRVMVEHGNCEAAAVYLLDCDDPTDFPYTMFPQVLQRTADPALRLRVLRHALNMTRKGGADTSVFSANLVVDAFGRYWKELPEDEARTMVREIVDRMQDAPAQEFSAIYGAEPGVTITNATEHTLFQILHVLRVLHPELADALILQYAQLNAAVRRFPNGMESVRRQEQESKAGESATRAGAFCIAASPRNLDDLRNLMRAGEDSNFDVPFEQALALYNEDAFSASPNRAPKEFWGSTNAFRSVLHRAGKRLGPAAGPYLARIPDDDLRLLAAIELEASLRGLPEFSGMSIEYRTTHHARTADQEGSTS